jgi:hypothetical protein
MWRISFRGRGSIARAAAFVIGGVAVLVVGLATPANAWSGPAYQGNDYARVIGVPDNIIEVCDQERDGHGVYADYYLNIGAHRTLTDANGSAYPCYKDDWYYQGYWIVRFRVCEKVINACSGWWYPDGPGGN